jgi:hypothetical protein
VHHSLVRFRERSRKLTDPQSTPDKSNGLLGEIAVDAFAFEFIGMVMIALCLVVLAIPSGRRPAKHARYE